MKKVIDAVYDYVCSSDDPDVCKSRLNDVVEFVIRLRHSYVDNDKPKSDKEINELIDAQAEELGLKVNYVKLG